MITSRKKKRGALTAIIVSITTFAAIAAFVIVMLDRADAATKDEALKAARDSVIRAAVSCYAYEGVYPESVDYLIEHYNLIINPDKYIIFYNKIADNLTPNIIVTER